MKLSTRGRYTTRALLDLALHQAEEPVLLKDIAQRQEISLRYLQRLMTPLVTASIVRSTRGPKGGVWLVKPPKEVKLSDIIQIMEGSVAPVACVDIPELCTRSEFCVTRDVWGELKKAIYDILESTTLQDLIERCEIKEQTQTKGYMYHI